MAVDMNHRKIFNCNDCNKEFQDVFSFLEHKNVHSGETPFLCSNCGSGFLSIMSYVEHARRFRNNHYFPCQRCGIVFYSCGELEKHGLCSDLFEHGEPASAGEEVITSNEEVPIPIIKHSFSISETDFTSLDESPKLNQYLGLPCQQCGAVFYSSAELQKHGLCFGLSTHGEPASPGVVVNLINSNEDVPNSTIKESISDTDMAISDKSAKLNHCFSCQHCGAVFVNYAELEKHGQCINISKHVESAPAGVAAINSKETDSIPVIKESNNETDLTSSDKNSKFVCNECGTKYSTLKLLERHLKRHPSKHCIKCNKCSKVFFTSTKLSKHNCSFQPVKCSCELTFNTADDFNKHIGSKPFPCCACDMTFMSKNNLKKHFRTHTKEKPFVCQECGRGFSQSANLRNHVSVHLGENAIKCDLCDFSCKTRAGLFKHKRKHKEGNVIGDLRKVSTCRLNCPECSRVFSFKRNLVQHLKSHRNYEEFLCQMCGRSFAKRKMFLAHLRMHHGTSSTCTHCGKVFPSEAMLSSHLRIHADSKQYKCHICRKTFAVRSYLSQHMKSHNNAKKFSCKLCKKLFKAPSSLKYHSQIDCMKADKLSYRLPCSSCGKKLKTSARPEFLGRDSSNTSASEGGNHYCQPCRDALVVDSTVNNLQP